MARKKKSPQTTPAPEETPEAELAADAAEGETPDPEDAEAVPEFGKDESVVAEFLKDDADDLDAEGAAPAAEEAPEGEKAPPAEAATPEETPEAEGDKAEAEAPPPVEAPLAEAAPVAAKPPEQVTPETPPEVPPAETLELTTEQLEERYATFREDAETALTSRYAITEEMAEELNTDAGQVIPRLMAKVYVDAVTATVGHIVNNMPALLESALAKRDESTSAEVEFFEVWPQLNGAEHRETISRFGVAYRQLYPDASKEQFIRDVGAQTMVALRIPVEPAPAEVPAETPAAPFRPAASAAPGGGPTPKKNPFEALSDNFDDEELDLDN